MRRAKILLFSYLAVIAAIVLTSVLGLFVSPAVERDADTYYEAYWNTINSFDPVRAYDTVSKLMLEQSLEGLYEFDGDAWSYDLIPCLAAEMPQISDDGRTYTIRIRSNVRYPSEAWNFETGKWEPVEPWRNTPRYVTAHDFAFAFQRMCDFHSSSPYFGGAAQDRIVGATEFFEATEKREKSDWYYDKFDLPGVEAIDDHTLRITLIEPYPQLIFRLTGPPLSPMPREYYEHYAVTIPTEAHNRGKPREEHETWHDRGLMKWRILATGPYQLSGYERERYVRFVHNSYYRGRPDVDGHPGGLGGVHPDLPEDRVLPYAVMQEEFLFSRNALPRWFNFTIGLYDKIKQIPRDQFGSAVDGGEISPALAKIGMRQKRIAWPSIEYILFHLREYPELRNLPLRRAMSLAIDREQLNKQFRNDDEVVPHGLIPPGFATYDDSGPSEWYRYDPEEAARLVEEAKRLHRERTGEELPTLTVSFRSTASTTKQMAEYLKLSWARIGLDIDVEFYDFGKWLDNLRSRNFMCTNGGWQADYPDEETFFALFHSDNYAGGGSNSSGYTNPEYDALFEQAKVMLDSPERRELYRQMAAIVERDLPVVMLYYRGRREFYFDWLGDNMPHPFLSAQPAYYRLDGALRKARLSGQLNGTIEELREHGEWPPPAKGEEP